MGDVYTAQGTTNCFLDFVNLASKFVHCPRFYSNEEPSAERLGIMLTQKQLGSQVHELGQGQHRTFRPNPPSQVLSSSYTSDAPIFALTHFSNPPFAIISAQIVSLRPLTIMLEPNNTTYPAQSAANSLPSAPTSRLPHPPAPQPDSSEHPTSTSTPSSSTTLSPATAHSAVPVPVLVYPESVYSSPAQPYSSPPPHSDPPPVLKTSLSTSLLTAAPLVPSRRY